MAKYDKSELLTLVDNLILSELDYLDDEEDTELIEKLNELRDRLDVEE
jgi:hypothetical protein